MGQTSYTNGPDELSHVDPPSHEAGNVTDGAGGNANKAPALLSPKCGLVPHLIGINISLFFIQL